jgi:hypothetical protein
MMTNIAMFAELKKHISAIWIVLLMRMSKNPTKLNGRCVNDLPKHLLPMPKEV